LLSILNITIII